MKHSSLRSQNNYNINKKEANIKEWKRTNLDCLNKYDISDLYHDDKLIHNYFIKTSLPISNRHANIYDTIKNETHTIIIYILENVGFELVILNNNTNEDLEIKWIHDKNMAIPYNFTIDNKTQINTLINIESINYEYIKKFNSNNEYNFFKYVINRNIPKFYILSGNLIILEGSSRIILFDYNLKKQTNLFNKEYNKNSFIKILNTFDEKYIDRDLLTKYRTYVFCLIGDVSSTSNNNYSIYYFIVPDNYFDKNKQYLNNNINHNNADNNNNNNDKLSSISFKLIKLTFLNPNTLNFMVLKYKQMDMNEDLDNKSSKFYSKKSNVSNVYLFIYSLNNSYGFILIDKSSLSLNDIFTKLRFIYDEAYFSNTGKKDLPDSFNIEYTYKNNIISVVTQTNKAVNIHDNNNNKENSKNNLKAVDDTINSSKNIVVSIEHYRISKSYFDKDCFFINITASCNKDSENIITLGSNNMLIVYRIDKNPLFNDLKKNLNFNINKDKHIRKRSKVFNTLENDSNNKFIKNKINEQKYDKDLNYKVLTKNSTINKNNYIEHNSIEEIKNKYIMNKKQTSKSKINIVSNILKINLKEIDITSNNYSVDIYNYIYLCLLSKKKLVIVNMNTKKIVFSYDELKQKSILNNNANNNNNETDIYDINRNNNYNDIELKNTIMLKEESMLNIDKNINDYYNNNYYVKLLKYNTINTLFIISERHIYKLRWNEWFSKIESNIKKINIISTNTMSNNTLINQFFLEEFNNEFKEKINLLKNSLLFFELNDNNDNRLNCIHCCNKSYNTLLLNTVSLVKNNKNKITRGLSDNTKQRSPKKKNDNAYINFQLNIINVNSAQYRNKYAVDDVNKINLYTNTSFKLSDLTKDDIKNHEYNKTNQDLLKSNLFDSINNKRINTNDNNLSNLDSYLINYKCKTIRCNNCRIMNYCNIKYQKSHWRDFHFIECFIKKIIDKSENCLTNNNDYAFNLISRIIETVEKIVTEIIKITKSTSDSQEMIVFLNILIEIFNIFGINNIISKFTKIMEIPYSNINTNTQNNNYNNLRTVYSNCSIKNNNLYSSNSLSNIGGNNQTTKENEINKIKLIESKNLIIEYCFLYLNIKMLYIRYCIDAKFYKEAFNGINKINELSLFFKKDTAVKLKNNLSTKIDFTGIKKLNDKIKLFNLIKSHQSKFNRDSSLKVIDIPEWFYLNKSNNNNWDQTIDNNHSSFKFLVRDFDEIDINLCDKYLLYSLLFKSNIIKINKLFDVYNQQNIELHLEDICSFFECVYPENDLMLAKLYFYIFFYLLSNNRINLCVDLLSKVIDICNTNKNYELLCKSNYNLGIVYFSQGYSDHCIHYLEVAYKISVTNYTRVSSVHLKLKILEMLVLAYISIKEFKKAYPIIFEVINIRSSNLNIIDNKSKENSFILSKLKCYLNFIVDYLEYEFYNCKKNSTMSNLDLIHNKQDEIKKKDYKFLINYVTGTINESVSSIKDLEFEDYITTAEFLNNLSPYELLVLNNNNSNEISKETNMNYNKNEYNDNKKQLNQTINSNNNTSHNIDNNINNENESYLNKTILQFDDKIACYNFEKFLMPYYEDQIKCPKEFINCLTKENKEKFMKINNNVLKRSILLRDPSGEIDHFNINYHRVYSKEYKLIIDNLKSNYLVREISKKRKINESNYLYLKDIFENKENNVLLSLSKYLNGRLTSDLIDTEKAKFISKTIKKDNIKINENNNIKDKTDRTVKTVMSSLNKKSKQENLNSIDNFSCESINKYSTNNKIMTLYQFKTYMYDALKLNENKMSSYILDNTYKTLNNEELFYLKSNPEVLLNFIDNDISLNANENLFNNLYNSKKFARQDNNKSFDNNNNNNISVSEVINIQHNDNLLEEKEDTLSNKTYSKSDSLNNIRDNVKLSLKNNKVYLRCNSYNNNVKFNIDVINKENDNFNLVNYNKECTDKFIDKFIRMFYQYINNTINYNYDNNLTNIIDVIPNIKDKLKLNKSNSLSFFKIPIININKKNKIQIIDKKILYPNKVYNIYENTSFKFRKSISKLKSASIFTKKNSTIIEDMHIIDKNYAIFITTSSLKYNKIKHNLKFANNEILNNYNFKVKTIENPITYKDILQLEGIGEYNEIEIKKVNKLTFNNLKNSTNSLHPKTHFNNKNFLNNFLDSDTLISYKKDYDRKSFIYKNKKVIYNKLLNTSKSLFIKNDATTFNNYTNVPTRYHTESKILNKDISKNYKIVLK